MPAGLWMLAREGDAGALRRIALEQRLQRRGSGFRVQRRRQPEHQLGGGEGPQRVASASGGGRAVEAHHGKAWLPGVGEHQIRRRHRAGAGVPSPRKSPRVHLAQGGGHGFGLLANGLRNRHLQRVDQRAAGGVLHPFDKLPQQPEAGGHDAAGRAGVNALGEHLHRERAGHRAAQGRSEPQLIVVAALGVQAHHQVRLADFRRQQVHVVRQIEAAALLAALDQHQAARMRQPGLLQRGDGRQRAEAGVAVVRPAAPVQLAIADHGLPRPKPGRPAVELRLLVVVAVEQHVALAAAAGRHVAQEQRRPLGQGDDALLEPPHPAPRHPAGQMLRRGLHMPERLPIRLERRGLVGDADVLHQRRDDAVVPHGVYGGADLAAMMRVHLCLGVLAMRPMLHEASPWRQRAVR